MSVEETPGKHRVSSYVHRKFTCHSELGISQEFEAQRNTESCVFRSWKADCKNFLGDCAGLSLCDLYVFRGSPGWSI